MFKKLKYIFYLAPIFFTIRNLSVIFFLFLFPGKDRKVELRSGVEFWVSHFLDLLTIKEIFLDEEYAMDIKDPKTIIDIGANIGDYTTYASRKFPKSKVFAYEPAESTYKLLQKNVKENKLANVRVFKLGVAGKSGTRTFYTHQASGLSSLSGTRGGMAKEKIKVVVLADVFKNNKITKCDILKIDAEGAEYEILFNASKKTIKKIHNIVLEYHNSLTKHNGLEIVKFLRKNGFKVRKISHRIEKDIGIIYAKR